MVTWACQESYGSDVEVILEILGEDERRVYHNPSRARCIDWALRFMHNRGFGYWCNVDMHQRENHAHIRLFPVPMKGGEKVTEEKELPFAAMPSGVDIMHYFAEETEWRNNGGDGINLWRDGNDYTYLWVEAHVDHDIEHYFLLDIRTNINHEETRDYLWVSLNIFDRDSMECEWHNHPVAFGSTFEAHMARFEGGMEWFLGHIMDKRMEAAGKANEPTAQAE